jgi:type II secretory pathway pseudopilin PulG
VAAIQPGQLPRHPTRAGEAEANQGLPRRAFSLLELLVILAIVASIIAIALPRYGHTMARYQADVAARRIVSDLALARAEARQNCRSQTIIVDPVANQIRMPGVAHLDDGLSEYVTELAVEPYCATLVSADFGGDGAVIFDGYGVPDSGGTAVVRSGGEQRTVVLNQDSGEAVVQ